MISLPQPTAKHTRTHAFSHGLGARAAGPRADGRACRRMTQGCNSCAHPAPAGVLPASHACTHSHSHIAQSSLKLHAHTAEAGRNPMAVVCGKKAAHQLLARALPWPHKRPEDMQARRDPYESRCGTWLQQPAPTAQMQPSTPKPPREHRRHICGTLLPGSSFS